MALPPPRDATTIRDAALGLASLKGGGAPTGDPTAVERMMREAGVAEEEVDAMLQHAHRQRKDVGAGELAQESISMSQEMAELMNKHPWISVSTTIFVTM